jgi:GR25 family glycosyltransferase involved in LPS biosynthesis
MKVLLINLEADSDRLTESLLELSKLECEVVRIDAVVGENLDEPFRVIDSAGVVGCWHSHQAAYEYILSNNLPGAIVVEDDVMIRNPGKFMHTLTKILSAKLDIVQLGFIAPHPISRFEATFQNLEHILFTIIEGCSLLTNVFRPRINRLEKYANLPPDYIPDEFLSGTHCYYVSATGAEKLRGKNIPVMIPADGYIRNLVKLNYLNGGRVVHSLANQRAMLSTITGRRNKVR